MGKLKNIVMIAHAFPPEGNAGSYRPLRFVRQLSRFGWHPTVITARPQQYERFDPALLGLVPDEVQVIEVKSSDLWHDFMAWRSRRGQVQSSTTNATGPESLEPLAHGHQSYFKTWARRIISSAEARWYHPDLTAHWIIPAAEAAIEICNNRSISVIWATAGPMSSFYAARVASVKTNVPYVLDFRDAWTITHNDFEAKRPSWAVRRDRKKMFELLYHAQSVIFRYDTEAECFWRAYQGALDSSKIYIIPNGYESPVEERSFVAGDKCIILYAGTLPDYRYDTLLQALIRLKQTEPSRANALRLLFIGEGSEAIATQAEALHLSDIVQTGKQRSHAEIRLLEQTAHALLVLGRPSTMRGHELFAGAKLFGYLKAGRPIVGILPKDETKNILERLNVRTLADVDSLSEITQVLRLIIDNWRTATLESLIPDRKACEAFSSERQTAILVRALERMPPEQPFIPGCQSIPPSLQQSIEAIDGMLNE